MSKELFIAAMEELMDEGFTYDEAGDLAYERMCGNLADIGDRARDRAKDDAL